MSLVREQPTRLAQPVISLPACERAEAEGYGCNRRWCTCGAEYRGRSHDSSFLRSFNRKRFIVPALCLFLLIVVLYLYDLRTTGGKGVGAATNFLRRAVDTTAGDGDRQGAFIRQKLYLIVVFVGAFILLWAFLVFSLWCCREAFENPCCCPCYLCAYCGGIACLECILCC